MKNVLAKESACWIWYPGDWEIWQHEQISIRRKMRGVIFPAFWRLDRHYSSVVFSYTYELEQDEEVTITADGHFSVYFDGRDNERYNQTKMMLPRGKHELMVAVYNDIKVPALFIEGAHIKTNESWKVSCYDKQWHCAGSWEEMLNDPTVPPSEYRLATIPKLPVNIEKKEDGWMVDFGRETFGYLQLNGISGRSGLRIYYGESREEADDREHCVQLDRLEADSFQADTFTLPETRAFRYVQIVPDSADFQLESISMLYEYLPVDYRGSFQSSNQRLNDIWETSLYTFHLNTREFFFDGIKRDRWVWSGDAYQSFLMNYYSFFNLDVAKRTLIALRGKDPVVAHMNTILDYSLYWFSGIYDYYIYTGDAAFVQSQYEKMVSLMDFCLGRRNGEGMMEGIEEDWVFVDWADIDNRGEVSTVQVLLCRSLETMALVAELVGDTERKPVYQDLAKELRAKIMDIFWDHEQGGLVHSRFQGILNSKVTKYPNMFALMYGYLDQEQVESVKRKVMLNPEVQGIKTPYMRFYELAALCEVGEHQYVLEEMLDYWGGMLDLGATSFWEEFDPKQTGHEHYEMYGMPYGKSLCHAWGASPIYLIGKYFLGVKPLSPGYETYMVEPKLGRLEWLKGSVPVGPGEVEINMDTEKICVRATHGKGVLKYKKDGKSFEASIPCDGSWIEVYTSIELKQ
ncbi:alpha-L-rhamnosidase-related protein [Mesobacillus foraminis]|uniref:alpha-L-rhamnosidase-related protein n=1 Tax=Mesobacillus foraminis TaxID=279826 RepID=UPI000EF4C825|nr:amylo-alpha-1,6-glucosidase [Mesobacillus foraminis]